MLNIITRSPMVTIISSEKLNQPSTMAVVPTPLSTLPLPRSCAMIEAATEAVCCHNTETRMKIEAMKMIAREIWLTGREGNGFTSTSSSEPCEDSLFSECQPGKVARRRRQMKAKTIATMLVMC
jgi:hypothetical protein